MQLDLDPAARRDLDPVCPETDLPHLRGRGGLRQERRRTGATGRRRRRRTLCLRGGALDGRHGRVIDDKHPAPSGEGKLKTPLVIYNRGPDEFASTLRLNPLSVVLDEALELPQHVPVLCPGDPIFLAKLAQAGPEGRRRGKGEKRDSGQRLGRAFRFRGFKKKTPCEPACLSPLEGEEVRAQRFLRKGRERQGGYKARKYDPHQPIMAHGYTS